MKTGNQLHRQELPPPKQSSNQTPAQLGEAKCRLASKQILHLDITARASSEMLLRWSLLMSINATLQTERRDQHALFTDSEELPEQWTPLLQVVSLLLTCSKADTPCDSLGLSQDCWSDTTSPSCHKGRATTWDAQGAVNQKVTARTVLPAPPASGLFPALFARNLPSFPCTAGNCSGLDGISTWAQSYHMFRFPQTQPVLLPGNWMQMGFEVSGASVVCLWTNDHCAWGDQHIQSYLGNPRQKHGNQTSWTTSFILLEKRESNKQWRGARKALSKLTALGDLFPPLKPHPQTLRMRMDVTWILAQQNVAITHNFSLNMSSNAVC